MTYSTEAAKFGRIPTTFVECDMDFCSLRSGIGACTATQTGNNKCYNTYATCNDKPHFDKTVKTYRFCDQNADLPVGLSAIPLLKSVTFASQEITPNKGLGVRGSVSVSFIDAPFPDTEIDPYWKERTYDTSNQGTFWGKFKARNPFYENRVLRVRRGYLSTNFSWANFVDSVYIIEQLQGIAKDDSVKIVAKDMLKLADDKKALFPKPSNGRLTADITNSATSFTISPSGIGSQYAASGKIAVSGEVMSYTRSSDVFTITRGQSNTVAEAHKAEDTVQEVGIFSVEKIQDVIYTLLTTYSGISASYIDKTAWDLEATTFLAGVWSAEITEPTGINSLVGELTEQGTCRVWWDEIAQKIPFRAVKPLPSGLPTLSDDSHFLTKTIDIKTDTNQRVSTVLIYFAQKKPTEKIDELKNYELRVATPNLEAISSLEYGSNLIKKVFSRWLKKTSQGRANALADALLKTYRDPPQVMEFNLTPSLQLKVGDLFYAQTRKMQDSAGAIASVPMEVVYAQPTDKDDIKYKAQQVSTAIPIINTYTIIISADTLDLNLYDAFVGEYGTPETGITVNFEILGNVIISSSSTTAKAIRNPTNWPLSCHLYLIIGSSAMAVGCGGSGGNGGLSGLPPASSPASSGHLSSADAEDGEIATNGGDAILIEYPITIDNAGTIAGGGGGGGGGAGGGGGVHNFGGYNFAGGSGGGGGAGAGRFYVGSIGIGAASQAGTGGAGGGGAGSNGGTASATTGGAGGAGGTGQVSGYTGAQGTGGAGGAGGNLGQDGANGGAGTDGDEYGFGYGGTGGAGGSGGAAIVGNSLITWTNTGTRYGTIVA